MTALIDYLSAFIGDRDFNIAEAIEKAPKLYRRYTIPKKKKGERRVIHHPTKITKALQVASISYLDSPNLVHPTAKAYIKGLKSPLLENAKMHCDYGFTIRVDVKDFFPSIRDSDFEQVYITRKANFQRDISKHDLELLKKILFLKIGNSMILAIGAPSSPYISNLVMYRLDELFYSFALRTGGSYTRYADDLTYSNNNKDMCHGFLECVRESFKESDHPKLKVNEDKTYLSSRCSRRVVTGLVICPNGAIKVGRDKKRFIRKLCFDYTNGTLGQKDTNKLKGYLAYLSDVEPTYLNNLFIKYGSSSIRTIMAS